MPTILVGDVLLVGDWGLVKGFKHHYVVFCRLFCARGCYFLKVDLVAVANMWDAYGWDFVLWLFGFGLILKFISLIYLLRLSLDPALLARFLMNVTTCLTLAVTPTPMLLPPMVLHHFLWSWLLGIEQIHPINWILALLFAALIATAVDSSILALGFGQQVGKKALRLIFFFNILAVSLAMIPHYYYVGAHPPQASASPRVASLPCPAKHVPTDSEVGPKCTQWYLRFHSVWSALCPKW